MKSEESQRYSSPLRDELSLSDLTLFAKTSPPLSPTNGVEELAKMIQSNF